MNNGIGEYVTIISYNLELKKIKAGNHLLLSLVYEFSEEGNLRYRGEIFHFTLNGSTNGI